MSEILDILCKCPNRLNLLQGVNVKPTYNDISMTFVLDSGGTEI